MTTIQVEKRERSNNDVIREAGKIPAVYYGLETQSTPIVIDLAEFQRAWREAGETTAISLQSSQGALDALIHDVQFHPVTGTPIHADFLLIDKSKAIEVPVPFDFTGEAPIEKNNEGRIVRVLHEIELRGKPDDIPHEISVDLSGLKTLDDQITVADLTFPENTEALNEPDEVVVAVTGIREEEEEEEESGEIDFDAIEVEEKGKQEVESGEDEEGEDEQ